MNSDTDRNQLAWSRVEAALPGIMAVEGGFSQAHRGFVSLESGQQIFIKAGVDENTIGWCQKEVAVYRYLANNAYRHIPKLLAANEDDSAFALEPLTAEAGWDWTDNWTPERLEVTLRAMDELAELRPAAAEWTTMGQLALDASRDGWASLHQSTELQEALMQKLTSNGNADLAKSLHFETALQRSSQMEFRTDRLVHYDVRADNCAWNQATKQVRFIDWNWSQLGDRRFDNAAMLVHVQKSGMDVLPEQDDRLDAGALHWMAGFWFKAAATPIWPGGPEHLRDFQLESAVTALRLIEKM